MKNKKFYFFIGTTAELIKLAPIIREFEKRLIDFRIIASNQNVLHFEEITSIINKKSSDYTFRVKSFKYPQNIYFNVSSLIDKLNYIFPIPSGVSIVTLARKA